MKLGGFAAGLAFAAMLVQGCSPTSSRQQSIASADGIRSALAAASTASPPWLRAFYASRDFDALWIANGSLAPAGEQLLALLRRAGEEGLDAHLYLDKVRLPRSKRGSQQEWARTDIALSLLLADYLRDLTRPPPGFFYVDDDVPRRGADIGRVLRAIGRGAPIDRVILKQVPANAIYTGLKNALAKQRMAGRTVKHRSWIERERTILRNMDRSRALPVMTRGRFLLVDTAAARLLMIEDGAIRDAMRVIVGKREEQTPDMAGLLRFAVLNPYWNLPPDLVARRAQHILVAGPGLIAAERLELLADWSDNPRALRASEIDWKAVAEGRRKLRARQLPGGHNMMGKIKFMMPNPLGIYLHDTPLKEAFARTDRQLSAGCVRVEDADRLARWLFGGRAPRTGSTPERRADLPRPVPVYMLYLTAMPDGGRLAIRPDVYRRDAGPRRTAAHEGYNGGRHLTHA